MRAQVAGLVVAALLFGQVDAAQIRISSAKAKFKRTNPCPTTGARSGPCGGYVIDHIVPLAFSGPDAPGNMQWQTKAEATAKDRWELKGCRK